jgi:hypothetical protein
MQTEKPILLLISYEYPNVSVPASRELLSSKPPTKANKLKPLNDHLIQSVIFSKPNPKTINNSAGKHTDMITYRCIFLMKNKPIAQRISKIKEELYKIFLSRVKLSNYVSA